VSLPKIRSTTKDGRFTGADQTVRLKLRLLADLGRWFGQTGLAVAHLDERRVDAFVKHRQQVRRGDLKTLEQFLDLLRKRVVIPRSRASA
jgi:hypothetical protein